MKRIEWNELKNLKLKVERGICFDDILTAIESGSVLERIDHPNQTLYPNQHVMVVAIDDYIYLVPYVEDSDKLFLKTIYPSRKMTKKYLKGDAL